MTDTQSGSSPLTRGKPDRLLDYTEAPGLIPAHAGKTTVASGTPSRVAAHPRSRGENRRSAAPKRWGRGSSPLTRGKLSVSSRSRPRAAAHPRSRGENMVVMRAFPSCQGSSPLTRGKQTGRLRCKLPVGLIPAHAGKTAWWLYVPYIKTAHPRSRGENYEAHALAIQTGGSSPLTRGKHRTMAMLYPAEGLIPAHAGKTRIATSVWSEATAHPRSRGENLGSGRSVATTRGSSPLTRGKLVRGGAGLSACGLIPAHAGKTRLRQARASCLSAHPRSRGENWEQAAYGIPPMGSSPLTRGKPAPRDRLRLVRGLIPAHAGKTPASRPAR